MSISMAEVDADIVFFFFFLHLITYNKTQNCKT